MVEWLFWHKQLCLKLCLHLFYVIDTNPSISRREKKNVCTYARTLVCMYVCMCVCVCVCVYVCMYVPTRLCVCLFVCRSICIQMYACVRAYNQPYTVTCLSVCRQTDRHATRTHIKQRKTSHTREPGRGSSLQLVYTVSHFSYAPLIKCKIIQKGNRIFLI